ncbi:MAG: filamentous hemagglutinin N-terminal domain-containing protein [Phormidesmis sp.]
MVAFNGFTLAVKGEPLGVNPDGTTQTAITGDVTCATDCIISGKSRSGNNLFHSFSEFSIPQNATVAFMDDGAANIFARVSDKTSFINGTIAVLGEGNANFFLLNPQGVIFGPQSALLGAGSFLVSTAESISFSDGVAFSAAPKAVPPLLTMSAPVGFEFGSNASAVVNRSQASLSEASNSLGLPTGLRVNEGKTLVLLGNQVLLENGSLTAIGGRLQIGSVENGSRVSLSPELTLGYERMPASQNIQIRQKSIIDASGGGQLTMFGRNIEIAKNSIITNFTTGSETAGTINLRADEAVQLTGGAIIFSPLDDSVGKGVDLNISAKRLVLQDGAIISGGTFGQSSGGSLTINASDSVELSGAANFSPTLITTSTEGSGGGGNITINTQRLSITAGAQIQAVTYGSGKGGDITINASQVEIRDLATTAFSGESASGILASSGVEGLSFQPTGEGGSIIINAEALTLDRGAQISVNSLWRGNSGNLKISARRVKLDGGAQITAAAAFGNGGNLRLENLESLLLRRGSLISTQVGSGEAQGNGGNIFIDSDFILARPLENSDIVAKATQGRGGNIEISTRGLYGIERRRSLPNNQTNDIDASSDFGISGTTAINQLGSKTELETSVIEERPLETSASVSQRCNASGNRFVITARGGIPTTPARATETTSSLIDLGESYPSDDLAASVASASNTVALGKSSVWIEADGWQVDRNGQIRLVARSQNDAFSLPSDAQCAG